MRAQVNYQSVKTMIEKRLFPEPASKWGTYPVIKPSGEIIFHGHAASKDDPEKPVSFIRCSITPDGLLTTHVKRHAVWLQAQADLHGLPLDLVVIPPPPQQQKLPKNAKAPKPHPYRTFTTRDGSEACAVCYAPKSDPLHVELPEALKPVSKSQERRLAAQLQQREDKPPTNLRDLLAKRKAEKGN